MLRNKRDLMCAQACLDLGPAIIYNVPARTAQDIPDDVIADLAAHANFLGVKECTGNQRIQVPPPQKRRGVRVSPV
jgi:Dihydrodipicolinate synthetase family